MNLLIRPLECNSLPLSLPRWLALYHHSIQNYEVWYVALFDWDSTRERCPRYPSTITHTHQNSVTVGKQRRRRISNSLGCFFFKFGNL